MRYPTMRGWKFCVGFYAREGFGTRRKIFRQKRYRMMPAVSDSPLFIGALIDLVLSALEVPAKPSSQTCQELGSL
jgi:hypothetical protein